MLEIFALLLLVLLLLLSVLDQLPHLDDIVALFLQVSLELRVCVLKLALLLSDCFEALVLLFLRFGQLVVGIHQLGQLQGLLELCGLQRYAFQVCDLHPYLLDLLVLLFLLFSLQRNFIVTLAPFLLECVDLVHLVVRHSQGGPVLAGLVEDLTDQLLALLYQFLLSFV